VEKEKSAQIPIPIPVVEGFFKVIVVIAVLGATKYGSAINDKSIAQQIAHGNDEILYFYFSTSM